MSTVRVACAIIIKDKKILAAQRSTLMSLPLKWEFPGGKIKAGENEEECVHRELKEELNIFVKIERKLHSNVHDYGTFKIELIPFIVQYLHGDIAIAEHKNVKWLTKSELISLDWAPADIPILKEFLNLKF